ncbi:MAG: glycoside hydrolase family 30 protein [Saprospirales bacterium]|nr:glycoside hydrolase family 30 protein [Saprospirales bacterium]
MNNIQTFIPALIGCIFLNVSASFGQSIAVYTTAENTPYRLSQTETLNFSPHEQPFENQACVFIDPSATFQTFLGIGGAFTDAAAETFAKLPADRQAAFLEAYFDRDKGIGYSFGRTNINSCDFSSDMYTYVDEGDKMLSSFNIAHDEKFKIPFIKKATEAAGGKLNLFVSPWSPPAWMKDNNNMLQGGKLKPEFYDSWARYYVRFIQEYEERGIPVWGLSVQNEPMAKQTWESCIFTAEEETDFIKNHLGPVLKKNKMSDKKLIAWDHNRDLLYHRATALLNDRKAAKYIWGIGFHWYEIWNGGRQYENVKRVAEAFPDKNLLLTEACNYPFSWETFDQWHWGEQYGENMIHDFNNGAVAWTDWNILLDETGGPNHVQNFCFAPVHAKTREGSLHFMNSYYYIGHFSKFILPGAKRMISSSNRAQLLTTAFLNPDGKRVVVVMNNTNETIPYRLYSGERAAETVSLPHSIMTLVY